MSEKVHTAILDAPSTAIELTHVHPVVALAMRNGATDPATLRELMELQRIWEAGEAKKAFVVALVALKRELPTSIARDTEVRFANSSGVETHYWHTSLSAAMAAVATPLADNGFTLNWQTGEGPKGDVRVTCRLMHKAGHSEETTLSAPPDGKGGKNGAQAVASTVTMLQRYTALSLLGIATKDMTENHEPREPAKPAPEQINTKRNLAVAGRLKTLGLSVAEAEQFVERKVADWTSRDIDAIAEWQKKQQGT